MYLSSSITNFSLFSNIDDINDIYNIDDYEIIKILIANYGNANANITLFPF